MIENQPGDSAEQRLAEPEMLAALGERLGVTLRKRTIKCPGGSRLDIDGASEEPLILCEAYAHQGSLKSAQTNKVVADALRLLLAEKILGTPARKIILFADEDAAKSVAGRRWVADAFHVFDVEVEVVPLREDLRERLRQAQRRQYR